MRSCFPPIQTSRSCRSPTQVDLLHLTRLLLREPEQVRLAEVQCVRKSKHVLTLQVSFSISSFLTSSGIVNAVLASPVELLKIKMQAQYGSGSKTHYSGPVDCARQLIKEHGFRHGLMRGYWISVVREIPGYAGFYAGFEGMKRYLTPAGENPATYAHGLLALMASGATGGVSYWFACYPLDMLKSMVKKTPLLINSRAMTRRPTKQLFDLFFNPLMFD